METANPSPSSGNETKLSRKELIDLLTAELENADIQSPCSSELFYAVLNGEKLGESEREEHTEGPTDTEGSSTTNPGMCNHNIQHSSSNTIISDITFITEEDSSICKNPSKRRLTNESILSVPGDRVDLEHCYPIKEEPKNRWGVKKVLDNDIAKPRRSKDKKSVSFNTVSIRYYERIFELNPAVSSGVAIGIGWKYRRGGQIALDDYELYREHMRYSGEALRIPRDIREAMVKERGFTQKEIAEGTRICLRLKKQRRQTFDNLHLQGVEETFESLTRKIVFNKLLLRKM